MIRSRAHRMYSPMLTRKKSLGGRGGRPANFTPHHLYAAVSEIFPEIKY